MTPLARFVAIGGMIAALALGLQAQEPSENGPMPSEETLQNWLRSGDPRLEAWGAHDVLLTRNQNLVPDLLNLTEKWEPLTRQTCGKSPCSALTPDQLDERDAMAAVLDTLIQMNVAVRTETLRNLAPDFDNDVSILLARMPDEDSTQLRSDFYHSPPPPSFSVQYVSAALLALHPTPGFAADLLSSITVRGTIFVVPEGGGYGSGSGGSCGYERRDPRRDWPLTGQYRLSGSKDGGAILVVGGIDPVYALRSESTYYTGAQCGMGIGLMPEGRRDFIAEMSGTSLLPWRTSFQTNIVFESVEQTRADILNFLRQRQNEYRATANALVDRGVMAAADVEDSLPEIKLQIYDERGPAADPLPPLTNLPPHVRLAGPFDP